MHKDYTRNIHNIPFHHLQVFLDSIPDLLLRKSLFLQMYPSLQFSGNAHSNGFSRDYVLLLVVGIADKFPDRTFPDREILFETNEPEESDDLSQVALEVVYEELWLQYGRITL